MSFFEKAKKFTGSLRDKITAFLAGKRWKNSDSHITDTKQNPEIRKTCDMEATKTRDMNSPIEEKNGLETPQSRLKHFVSVKRDTAQSVKRDMLLTAGNVGIGTTSPSYKLDVAGNLHVSATSTFDGNVGIGTAPSSYALEVNGNIKLTPSGAINKTIDFGQAFGNAALYLYNAGTGLKWGWGLNGGEMQFFGTSTVGGSQHISFNKGGDLQASGSNEVMRIVLDSGNVGIGTTSPSYKLDVNGTLNASATSTFAGRVGIGTTAPNYALEVNGDASLSSAIFSVSNSHTGSNVSTFQMLAPNLETNKNTFFTIGKAASVNNSFTPFFQYVGDGSASNYFGFTPYGSGSLGLFVQASGNVGIGTPSADVANRPSGLVPLVPSVSTDEGSREPKVQKGHAAIAGNVGSGTCPYCQSKDFVKRGTRQKAKERVQLYLCRNCRRTFTPFAIKGKSYSLPVIIDAISYYNIGFSFEQTAKVLKEKQAVDIQPTTVANWYEEYRGMCAYARMRPFAVKEYSPYNVVETATLAHRQLYRFRFHKAKAKLIIKESFRHYHLKPMAEFLALVPSECPHQYFQEGLRASEAPLFFSKKEMIVRSKQNYATKMAGFAVPAASDNKQRHETLQKFMLFNDSVTVATEVPVHLTREDLAHMRTQLGFEVYRPAADIEAALLGQSQSDAGPKRHAPKSYQLLQRDDELPKLITGHVDFIQIRNGSIHILDYKPNAAKEKPIEQLTLYALALSRLTGLRLFEFKCAWFDEKNYFEFFPLHVVYKRKKGNRKKIRTKEGIYSINERMDKVENMCTIEV